MSRSEKRRKREKRERLRTMAPPLRPRANDLDVLEEALALFEHGDLLQARSVLEEADQRRPDQSEVLRLLLDVLHEQQDYRTYCTVAGRLLRLEPGNRPLHLALAEAHLLCARVTTALSGFRRFVERWPDDPLVEGARLEIERLEPLLDRILGTVPFPVAERYELAALHEEMLALLGAGDHERVVTVGRELLRRVPDFTPAMNNVAVSSYELGRIDEAFAHSRRVLELRPDNPHALSKLAQWLFLGGRGEEAAPLLERLRDCRSNHEDIWVCKAEALAMFGDDQGVLEALRGAEEAGVAGLPSPSMATLHHLAAVAAARQGDERRARRLWQRALEVIPDLNVARDNREELDRPAAERNPPWFFETRCWITQRTFNDLGDALTRCSASRSASVAIEGFVSRHPEVAALVPHLLDRGDPNAVELAVQFARQAQTPALNEALRAYAFGRRGPDRLRFEAMSHLSTIGVIPSDPVQMWLRGKWSEVEPLAFDVTQEPIDPGYGPPASDWSTEAYEALQSDDGERAEILLRKCLTLVGERPWLLNNLAAALLIQGRDDESVSLTRRVQEQWPDYFFGRIALTHELLRDDKVAEAEDVLHELCRRKRRLHTTEFSALCHAQVRLLLRSKKFEGAEMWMGMWERVVPDDADLDECKRALTWSREARSLAGSFGRFLSSFRR